MDTGGHGDDHRGAARGGQWSEYDVTTGTSPTTDTQPTAPTRKAGGGRRSATPTATATGRPTRRLVIVESPAKAKKIAPLPGHATTSSSPSVGHIRDLPRGAADVPAKYKGEAWARLGVDVDNDFEPLYVVTPEKKGKVSELRDALKERRRAATSPRTRTARARPSPGTCSRRSSRRCPVRRMVFHEITEPAIRAAAANPRDLDQDLVDAQETRRILDRLYGYEVCPVLWKKVMPRLSAGRVQSVATRIIVERERERMAFVAAGYWDIAATLDAGRGEATPRTFSAAPGHRRRRPRRHRPRLRPGRAAARATSRVLDEGSARRLAEALHGRDLTVTSRRGEAVHAQALRAVHDLDAAAGGRPQAALLGRADDAHRAAAVRERLHHLHAYRLDDAVGDGDQRRPRAGPGALRRRYVARRAAAVHPQGEERAGGARGDPAGRGDVPHPGPGGQRARRRRVPALRADLAAHRRLPDGRRARHHGERADHRHRRRPARSACSPRPGARSPSPASCKAYVETVDDQAGGEADDAESRLPRADPGPGADRRELRPGRPHHEPARRATPRRAWSRRWRSSASAGRRRTRRSSRRSRTAATCGRRAARWCRPGSPSR